MESRYIHKRHNVSVLMYHLVCAAKYRRVVIGDDVDIVLRDVCLDIEKRWEIRFLEIGFDGDHAHFLIQSVPTYSPWSVVQRVKSVTAREVFARVPDVKKQLWGGEFWGKGYFVNSVGQHGSEDVIAAYVKRQGAGANYVALHKSQMDLEMSLNASLARSVSRPTGRELAPGILYFGISPFFCHDFALRCRVARGYSR